MREYLHIIDEMNYFCEAFDPEKFLRRAESVQGLIDRGATEGEKQGARNAMERLIAQANIDASPDQLQSIKRRLDAIRNKTTISSTSDRANREAYARAQAQAQERAKAAAGAARAAKEREARDRKARQAREQAEEMAYYRAQAEAKAREARGENFENKNTGNDDFRVVEYARFTEGTSNKVYGVVIDKGMYYTVWGRYGAVLSKKPFASLGEAIGVFNSKIKKGYIPQNIDAMTTRAFKTAF
jgi:hypothetical protein